MSAQNTAEPPESTGGFRWVNEPPADARVDPAVSHRTFRSQANQADVGYLIAFPADYDAPEAQARRYPVIYFLHGGTRGNEYRGLYGFGLLRPLLTATDGPPPILVFVNGGKNVHRDIPGAKGETAFLELVEHIDRTCRTIADRRARIIVGNSMGGRGVGRYLFKFADLIGTGVSNAGGHQREKPADRAGEGGGGAADHLESGDPANNSFDNATRYAGRADRPEVRLLVVVGNQDGNYVGNLEWCAHLARLKIAHELLVIPGTGHAINWKIHDSDRRVREFIADSLNHFLKNGSAPP